jgi:hypothetical protein
MWFFGKKASKKHPKQALQAKKDQAPTFDVDLPEGYMSKYITPSEADLIIRGESKIKGSCVVYGQIAKPAEKTARLQAVCADWAEKFGKEPGLCQYLFPNRKGTGLEICDNKLKPDWHYPFTGNGFIPVMYDIVLLYYLTRPLEPGAGHVLIYFDDDGRVVKIYNHDPSAGIWEKA